MPYNEDERTPLDDVEDGARFAIDTAQKIGDYSDKINSFASSQAASASFEPASFSSNMADSNAQQQIAAAQQTASSSAASGAGIAGEVGASSATGASMATAEAVGDGAIAGSATAGGATAAGGTAAGEAVATGSAGGPAGIVVGVIMASLMLMKKNSDNTSSSSEDNSSAVTIAAALLGIMFIIFTLVALITAPVYFLYNHISSEIKDKVEVVTEYFDETKKEQFFQELLNLSDVEEEINQTKSFNEETAQIYKAIIDQAIYVSFKNYCWDLVLKLPSVFNLSDAGYSGTATYWKLMKQPYPYALSSIKDGSRYTVGHYLLHHDEIENDDLNYAELLAIISQADDFTIENFSYSDLYDLLICDATVSNLFEIQILGPGYTSSEQFEQYDATGQLDETSIKNLNNVEAEEENPDLENEDSSWWADFWKQFSWNFNVELYPLGLQEEYAIIEKTPFTPNKNIPTMTNYQLLDNTELWLRDLVPSINLGPAYYQKRSSRSVIYPKLYSAYQDQSKVTGRSLLSYSDNSLVYDVCNKMSLAQQWCEPKYTTISYPAFEDETVILDMHGLINQCEQKGYRGKASSSSSDSRTTIAHSGCIDCCYVMVYEYFYRRSLNIQNVCENYVNANQDFVHSAFRNDYNLPGSYVSHGYNRELIKKNIASGKPVIFFLKGNWTYAGNQYHATDSTHYIVIMGFDSKGFYVYDPGGTLGTRNSLNGPIPYQAFYSVAGRTFVEFDLPEGCNVHYLVNTISEE